MGNRPFATACCGKVCPKVPADGNLDFEEPCICDPAGAVFQETMEDLSEVDRMFLYFASSTNVACIRWLRMFGANIGACDSNGTTSLHAACRSGSLAIVNALLRLGLAIGSTDVAGWTPLHVAVFMGRRAVAVHLLQEGADLLAENERSQTPSDLCTDAWLREALRSCAEHCARSRGSPWRRDGDELLEDVQVSSGLRFEPFFVPRTSVLTEFAGGSLFEEIGVRIFNQRPGQGMAFLVASGAVRDFPVEISAFLSARRVSRWQIGNFLGEHFSIASTLRLEFCNSIKMTGTGVVSCLEKVFSEIGLPPDLRKIDRLVEAVAQIWWLQHEHLKEKARIKFGKNKSYEPGFKEESDEEVGGLQLFELMSNYGVLHQLLFSTILLHWNFYSRLPDATRMTSEEWLEVNSGIQGFVEGEEKAKQVMEIQLGIYRRLREACVPAIQFRQRRLSATQDVPGSMHFSALEVPDGNDDDGEAEASFGCSEASVQGWVRLLRGFPALAGATGTVTYKHIHGILSEASQVDNAMQPTPIHSRPDPDGVADSDFIALGALQGPSAADLSPPVAGQRAAKSSSRANSVDQQARRDVPFFFGGSCDGSRCDGRGDLPEAPPVASGDCLWMALVGKELFLAPKGCGWAPYAFLHLDDAVTVSINEKALTLTLGRNASITEDAFEVREGLRQSHFNEAQLEQPMLQLVFLLPDGRWQNIDVPVLEVRIPDQRSLVQWRDKLNSRK